MHTTIPLTPCESSNINAFGYDAASQVLAVQFKGGNKVHEFPDVDEELADKFIKADSKGKAFAQHIRGRDFRYAELAPESPDSEGGTTD